MSGYDNAVSEARAALVKSRIVEKENLKAPVEALRYQKSLLETLRQLTAIQQELSTAHIELAALINLPPGSEMMLSVPEEMQIPIWNSSLEQMEDQAFINNPDLREQGYLTRISVDDTKKAILKLLPGITFTASRNYDYNSFLMENHWYEAGAKLTWNLMNLVSGPSALAYANTNEDVTSARRIALRMAVLAQVYISERQFRNATSQYQQSDELWQVDRRLAELAEAKTANDASGMLERVASHASAIASQLRRFQTYAQLEQSYSKMQATIGEDLLPDNVTATDLHSLSAKIAMRLDAWSKGGASVPVAADPSNGEMSPSVKAENKESGLALITRFLEDGFKKRDDLMNLGPITSEPSVSSEDFGGSSPLSDVIRFLKNGFKPIVDQDMREQITSGPSELSGR